MYRSKFILLIILLLLTLVPVTYANTSVATVYINEILVSNAAVNIDDDTTQFSDWIELYNPGSEAINLNGYFLTDDLADPQKYAITEDIWLAANDTILFWADDENGGVHTNFKLKGSGESVGLFDSDLQLVDSITYTEQLPDISFGRKTDGDTTWEYFGEPTPKSTNNTTSHVTQTRAPEPQFSLVGGFYSGSQNVELITSAPTESIYYTLDGSIPSQTSSPYTSPISISSTVVLRAKTYDSTKLPSGTVTQTYFIDETTQLPVVSVATNPENLWDDMIGIYVVGTNGIEGKCSDSPVNWNQDWERPSNVALYNLDSSVEFQLDAGIEIFGGCSRTQPLKSLAVRGRGKYGVDSIDVKLFDNKSTNSFRSIVLRNSGNEAHLTMFRDALQQQLVSGQMDIDRQGYRPVVMFLNGEYWGIHNIREKVDEDYVESNHGIDANQVDILESNSEIVEGDDQHYLDLIDYLENHDLSNPEYYEYVQTQIDIDEFLNYQIVEAYVVNTDWPAQNIKYWRPQTPTGRWRWFLYDLDWGFGFLSESQYNIDMIRYITRADGPYWPNPPWSTLILRNLLENQAFEAEFMQRFASHINITYAPQRVAEKTDAMQAVISPEMPAHIDRWEMPFTFSLWEDKIDVMRDFGNERPSKVLEDIDNYFGNPGTAVLTVNTVGAGDVYVSSVKVPASGYSGPYFKNVPMQLEAVPALGFEFFGWQETAVTDAQTALTINTDTTITAIFMPIAEGVPNLVINEIHYNPSSILQGADEVYEFLEIYNAGIMAINLDNYNISDGVEFTFPVGTSIAADEHIVVSIMAATYSGNGYQVFEWDFGKKLSNGGERVALYNDLGQVLDEVFYRDIPPWVTTPDGDGPSLSLVSPEFDNSLAISWAASDIVGGTPGAANSVSCTLPPTSPTTLSITNAVPDGQLSWTDNDPDESRGYEIWHSDTAVYFQPEDVDTISLSDVNISPYLHTAAITDADNHYYRIRSINRCVQTTEPSNLVGIFKYDILVGE